MTSVAELSFHNLVKVEVEGEGTRWLDLVLHNKDGGSITISVFASEKHPEAFRALSKALNNEFNAVRETALL